MLQRAFVRGAVDQVVALVAEAHGDRLDPALVQHADRDQERYVPVSGSNVRVVPEVARALHGGRDDAQPVERGRGALPGRRLALVAVPGCDRLRPERDGLHGGGLAAIVGTDEHRRMVQLDALPVAEALEVLDLQVVEQSHAASSPRSAGRRLVTDSARRSIPAPAGSASSAGAAGGPRSSSCRDPRRRPRRPEG